MDSPTPSAPALEVVESLIRQAEKHERNATVLSAPRPEGVMPRGGIRASDGAADKERAIAASLRQAATLIETQGKREAELLAALRDVINPLAALRRDAEAKGHRLSGMAYEIANSLSFVQGIARSALGGHSDG